MKGEIKKKQGPIAHKSESSADWPSLSGNLQAMQRSALLNIECKNYKDIFHAVCTKGGSAPFGSTVNFAYALSFWIDYEVT